MSWLFSKALMDSVNLPSLPEQVEEYSAESCSDGEQFAQLNVMPTQHRFWRNDKTMEFSNLSRFGLTCAVLTESRGAELLTSFLAAFPVRTSALLGKEQESQESAADCGKSLRGLLAKYDHGTCSWKTAQCSLLEDLEQSLEIWPRWGSTQNGECWERIMPMLRTREKEYGFWPSIRASDGERGRRGDLIQAIRGNQNRHFKMHPTPTASNTKANHLRGADKGKKRESRSYGENGPLNPAWTEWLMGWPIKWTEFAQLEMDKYRGWQQQHSVCSQKEPESLCEEITS